MPTDEASAAVTPPPDELHSPLRWTLLGAFAILLGLLVISGITAVYVLRDMHRQAQSIRAASAERAEALSNICVSIQVYDQTIARYSVEPRAQPDQEMIDGLGKLAAQVSDGWNRYPEERAFLETLRDLVEQQRRFYATGQPALLIREQAPVLHSRVLKCAQEVELLGGRSAQEDDVALLAQFGQLQRGLSRALLIAFGSGLLLVAASMVYIVRLERQTRGRYHEIARSRHELQLLSSRLVDAQETERRSISRELHDEVGQSLGALLVDLGRLPASAPEAKEQIDRMKLVAERTFQSVRNIALLLRPSMLDDLGLAAALEWQGREVSRNSEIEVDVQTGNLSEDLPDEYRICIYRFVQEALQNAVRHSAARAATVTVEQSASRILVRVKDNGAGFDPLRARGLGLLGMEERVKRLGGSFTVQSAPQQGTTATAELPWPPIAARETRMKKIRILLADDHNLIRAGLRRVVESQSEFIVAGEAEDGRQAVAMAESLKPDVVVMDIGMPLLNGIEAARQIRAAQPETQIVMLSMHSDEGYVLRALKAGAKAYLLKDSAEADLARAIRAAAEGKSFFSPAVGKVLLEDYMRKLQRTGKEDSYELLTPREREILQLVAEGKSSKEVANLLSLSVYTVETHRARVMQKLNLRGIPELILYAVRKGIIS